MEYNQEKTREACRVIKGVALTYMKRGLRAPRLLLAEVDHAKFDLNSADRLPECYNELMFEMPNDPSEASAGQYLKKLMCILQERYRVMNKAIEAARVNEIDLRPYYEMDVDLNLISGKLVFSMVSFCSTPRAV